MLVSDNIVSGYILVAFIFPYKKIPVSRNVLQRVMILRVVLSPSQAWQKVTLSNAVAVSLLMNQSINRRHAHSYRSAACCHESCSTLLNGSSPCVISCNDRMDTGIDLLASDEGGAGGG